MKNKALSCGIFTFCITLLSFNYINNNIDKIYSARADYYFKKNNIPDAQKYYEKAFQKGLTSSKQREIYINSIINSPLTIEAQEKLVKFIENPIEDVAQLRAKYFVYDIKREIYRKYPENYISNAVFNQKILRWGNNPIKYKFQNTENVPKYFIEEIEIAFSELEKNLDRQILFTEDQDNADIIIKFKNQNPAEEDDLKFVVAYTTPSLSLNKLKSMEIEFYLKDPKGNIFSKNQVYNTALHEIIHAIGFMGHCDDKENIMYLTKDSKTEQNDLRESLTIADINTIKLLYKIKPQITNIDDNRSEYIPYFVLGTETEINNEKIKEAQLYIKKAPELPAGYIDLAEGYVAEKDYLKAIKSLKKALTYSDTDKIKGMVYFNLAVTNFYIDNFEDAKAYLNKSIQIKDSEEKHYLLGEIYIREGKDDLAINEYQRLIKQNPSNIDYLVALTNIHILNRDFLKARKTLKSYLKNNPKEKNNPRLTPYGILKLGL